MGIALRNFEKTHERTDWPNHRNSFQVPRGRKEIRKTGNPRKPVYYFRLLVCFYGGYSRASLVNAKEIESEQIMAAITCFRNLFIFGKQCVNGRAYLSGFKSNLALERLYPNSRLDITTISKVINQVKSSCTYDFLLYHILNSCLSLRLRFHSLQKAKMENLVVTFPLVNITAF